MTSNTEEELRGALRDDLTSALRRLPELATGELTFTALSGGITNRNFLVTGAADGSKYVMRLAGNDTHLLGISREVEHAATVAAAGVGVGPEVVAFVRPEGYLVTRFIEGRPIPEAEMRTPERLRAVGDTLRRIHDGPAIPGLFVPLRIVEAYRALAISRGVTIPPEYELAAAIARRIELAFLTAPVELRPCHNDLLNANFIDDGSRVRIVDWEYAGMGDPFFDLGNFSINHELDGDADAELLRAYAGDVRAYELARIYRAQGRAVVLGGPHVTLVPDEAAAHADAIVVGYAEDAWPDLLRDFARGAMKREYRQAGIIIGMNNIVNDAGMVGCFSGIVLFVELRTDADFYVVAAPEARHGPPPSSQAATVQPSRMVALCVARATLVLRKD